MLIDYQLTQTSIILRVKIRQDTTGLKPGYGFTGISNSTSGLNIAAIADVEASTTAYTSSGSTIQTIATLGTYAAPSTNDCRFAQVDATNHPGVYELQLANTRYAVSGAKSLLVTISGVSGALECDVVIPLRAVNSYDGVRGGMTALPSTACSTPGNSLLTSGTGTDQLSVSAGKVLLQATQTGVTIPTVTTVTNQLTAAAIATGVWQDTTSGDFTVASSIGKSLFTSGNAPGAASGLALVGSNMGSVSSVTGSVGSISGITFPTNFSSLTINSNGGVNSYKYYDNGQSAYESYPSNLYQTVISSAGNVNGNVVNIAGTASAGTAGYVGIDWSAIHAPTSTVVLSGTTIATVTNQLTAAAIATGVWTDTTSSDFTTTSSPGKILVAQLGGAFTTTSSSIYSAASLANAPTGGSAPTVSQIATAVWQDTTAGDFTVSGSIGKSLFTSGNIPGSSNGISLVGSNMGSVSSVVSAVEVGSYASGQDPASLVFGATIYTGWTFLQYLKVAFCAIAGASSGISSGTPSYQDPLGVTRITCTASSGNRSGFTYNNN